jgi:hypothetical protein
MTQKTKIIITIVALLTSFAIGRWAAPEKVKIEKQVVTREKQVYTKDKDDHKKTTTTEVDKPDGTKTITTVITDDNSTKSTDTTDTATKETDTKEVTRGTSKVTLSALGGAHLGLGSQPTVYGGMISKPVLGPITISAWGLSNATIGMGIGLSF